MGKQSNKCNSEEFVRINIKVPKELHTRLKMSAVRNNMSLKFLCVKVFEDYMEGEE